MRQGRLLSPNETKFWLMDVASPMNSVVVLRGRGPITTRDLAAESDFKLPSISLDASNRPRWTEPVGGGVVQRERPASAMHWLRVAERLTDVRIGTEGHPPWHAVVVEEEGAETLVFAVHHSLTDYRTGLWAAHCFLRGAAPGPLAPACEDLLAPESFASADAEEIIEEWWSAKAGARWHAIGLERLGAFLPKPCKTRLDCGRFTAEDTAAFDAACTREGATPNGAVAVALRDAIGAARIGHSIDLSRFIKPPPDDGPGIAISHLSTDVGDGDFWSEAREVRARLFDGVMAGTPADELLVIARTLLRTTQAAAGSAAPIVITGGPTLARRDKAYDAYAKSLVVGSPRAGGKVIILSRDEDRLELLASSPADEAPLPLQKIAACLLDAVIPA